MVLDMSQTKLRDAKLLSWYPNSLSSSFDILAPFLLGDSPGSHPNVSPSPLVKSSKAKPHRQAPKPDRPVSHRNRSVGEAQADIIHQMLHAIHEMVDEWPGKNELDTTLDQKREGGEEGGNAGGFNVEAREGRHEVEERKAVQLGAQDGACDASPGRGAEPGLFVPID